MLISFGGADPDDVTGRALKAIVRTNAAVAVDVVVGSGYVHFSSLQDQANGRSNVRVYRGVPTLAPLLAQVDLAVGGCGVSAWERLSLGIPSLVITLAENQRPIAGQLQRKQLIRWVGHHTAIDEVAIADAFKAALDDGVDAEASKQAMALVDGRGAERVSAVMEQIRVARHA